MVHSNREPEIEFKDGALTLPAIREIFDYVTKDLNVERYRVEEPKVFEDQDKILYEKSDEGEHIIRAATVNTIFDSSTNQKEWGADLSSRIYEDMDHVPPKGSVYTHIYAENMPYGHATTFYTFAQEEKLENAVSERLESIEPENFLEGGYFIADKGFISHQDSEQDQNISVDGDLDVGRIYQPENISWDDLGADLSLKQKLIDEIQLPLQAQEAYELGNIEPNGIILHGPPGTGKTLTVEIAAAEADATVIEADGSEIYGELMGQSEQNVRKLFEAARENTPSFVFFDELDQISRARGTKNNDAADRVVNQLLTEIDGPKDNSGVRVIGTTNNLESIDPALKRPGRLSETIEMPPPNHTGRKQIFEINTDPNIKGEAVPASENLDYNHLAEITEGYTGAQIVEIIEKTYISNVRELHREENNPSIQENIDNLKIKMEDIEHMIESTGSDHKENNPDHIGFQ